MSAPRIVHVGPAFAGGVGAAIEGLTRIAGATHVRLSGDSAQVHKGAEVAHATCVHCHHALAWPAARSLARRLGVPAVMTVHVLQARQSRMRGLTAAQATRSERLEQEALAEADALTIGTRAARELLCEDHPGLDPARVTVLAPPLRLPSVARAGEAESGPLVAVTRFDALKGTDLLIEVVARVLDDPARAVVIAGGLPDNPRADARWREAFLAPLDAARRARLSFAGWLEADALADLYARASVFVSTSRIETYGLALAEALAIGVPAVASGIAVHREVGGERVEYADDSVESVLGAIARARLGPPTAPHDGRPAKLDEAWLHFWRRSG